MNDYLPTVQGGDLAPYIPAEPLLPSAPPAPGIDYLPDYSPPQPAAQHTEQAFNEVAEIFTNDMPRLGVPGHVADAAVQWYRGMVAAPVPHEPARHGYDLSGLTFAPEDRPYVMAFANHMSRRGADQASVRAMIWWHGELTRRLQQAQQQQRQRQQPQPQQRPSQGNTLDDLTDAEYEYVMRRAEADRRRGMDELQIRWANDFEPRMRVVQNYFAGLPAHERDYLESAVTKGGVLAANSPDFIDRMYRQAIGGMPTGSALQAEIAQLESRMKLDRRNYCKDTRLQLRLRELYRLRDGE